MSIIEDECLMDDPNIEIKYEDDQHFDDAFKNSGEEEQAEDEEEDDEGIVETKPKNNRKVDQEEECEMTDLERDKKKKKNKLNKLSSKRDSDSQDKSSEEDDYPKHGKKKNKRKDSFLDDDYEDAGDSDDECQGRSRRRKTKQTGKINNNDDDNVSDNNKAKHEDIAQIEQAKTKGKLNKYKKNSDDDEYEPGSEIIKKKKVAPKKKEERKEHHSKAKVSNNDDDEDEEEEINQQSDKKQAKTTKIEAKDVADKTVEKENEDKSATKTNNNFPLNLLFAQNGSKNKNLESLFSSPQQQAFLMALLEQQSKQANSLTDKKKKFMEDVSETENNSKDKGKTRKSRELRALEADQDKSGSDKDKRPTRAKVSNIKYVESDLEDLPEQFEERPREQRKPKGSRWHQEKQIKEQPKKPVEKQQVEIQSCDNEVVVQNFMKMNNVNPQINQEERVREYQEHQAKLQRMLGKYSNNPKPTVSSRTADQRVENEMERLQMEQELNENRIDEEEQILPKEGHFRTNDIPRGIAASRIIGDDIFLEVTWENRKNGETPESTVMSTAEIKHFDYSFLLDYYEAKILKTNKERIKNAQNGVLKGTQVQQPIPKAQNMQGTRNNNNNNSRTVNTVASSSQSTVTQNAQAAKKNKQKSNMVDLEGNNENMLGDIIIEDPYKQFMRDNQVFEVSDSEVVTQPLASKPSSNINKSNKQPQNRMNCLSIDSDDECIPRSSKTISQNYFDLS